MLTPTLTLSMIETAPRFDGNESSCSSYYGNIEIWWNELVIYDSELLGEPFSLCKIKTGV